MCVLSLGSTGKPSTAQNSRPPHPKVAQYRSNVAQHCRPLAFKVGFRTCLEAHQTYYHLIPEFISGYIVRITHRRPVKEGYTPS